MISLEQNKKSKIEEIIEAQIKRVKTFKELRELKGDREEENCLIDGIIQYLGDSQNYMADIMAMRYITYLYKESEKGKIKNTYTELVGVWDGNDKSIIKKYYPVSVKNNGTNLFIPGGCEEFHKLMISQAYLSIYDIESEEKDCRRHSYTKVREIYETLKDTKVENLLLMEYSLGIGYANQIFAYMKDIDSCEEFYKWEKMVQLGREIHYFFLRKIIIGELWEYISWHMEEENCVYRMEVILKTVIKYINFIIKNSLNKMKNTVSDIESEELYWAERFLKNVWNEYFNDDVAYAMCVQPLMLSDWRKIKTVEDCFAIVEDFRFTEHQLEGKVTMLQMMSVQQVPLSRYKKKNADVLCVEIPMNEVGREVLKRTVSRMQQEELPVEKEKLYKTYYKIRGEEFEELKIEQKRRAYTKEVKATSRKITSLYLYALIQKNSICDFKQVNPNLRNF